ncbi:hypothetical protein CXB51_029532 [Gossypium anomalum]|uniref:Reverse transcriptase n=1 Tax=Gossypium anomalum TaxID=47600 RepID=A0A8J6CTY4_9ROSI|nr:hypothetical protein CXB51_029532 [Gossypium anomalum]
MGEGLLQGAKASRRGPEISHLLFADDCILFGEATNRGAWVLKEILKEYESCSGQSVGTGKSISVFNDVWIPDSSNFRLSSVGINSGDYKVAELINNYNRKWNRERIVNTFPKEVAEKIFGIPLVREPHDDFQVWSGEPSGEYSVRSAYKLLQLFDPRAYALHTDYRNFYKKLWLLDLPTKIKITTWKTSWNYLPIRVNMLARKLTNNSTCPRCGGGAESMDHLFRECPVSIAVWSALSTLNVLQESNLDFVQWLTTVFALHPPSHCRLFYCALWAIWGDRNARIHNKTNRSGQEIASFVHSYLKELNDGEKSISRTSKEVKKWTHLPGQAVKINFYRAFDEHNQQSASGIVVRNSEGLVLLSYTKIHHRVSSAFSAEALASRKATMIVINMQGKKTIIEGDSLSITKKCKAKGYDKSHVGAYIHDIQQLKSRSNNLRFTASVVKEPIESDNAISEEMKDLMEMAGVIFI